MRHRICPVEAADQSALSVLVAERHSDAAVTDLEELYGRPAIVRVVGIDELERAIERAATETERLLALERVDGAVQEDDRTADVRDLAHQPPVIRYVNLLIRDAIDAGASDVHLEATREGLDVRFRLDGVLSAATVPPAGLQHAVVSRLKTIAELDIAERRRPQDGRIRVRLMDRELDLRVATVPTVHGESVVLRLLDRGAAPDDLRALGMPAPVLESLSHVLGRPHGLVLVTGPTGSGKTTTLYASLRHRDAAREKVVTVEDPVEYQLPGITQVPVNRTAGVTFASALRAILRQDPDVVLIGEMRDRETAEVAVQAAMTGHLVLSTLHTNDAIGAIPRLQDLGVADYLIGGTLEAILAQRLVRRLCRACAVECELDPSQAARLAGRPVGRARGRRAVGCPTCRGTGFRGRTGLFEFVRMSDELRRLISRSASRVELTTQAGAEGATPMLAHGWALVQEGVTSIEEVLRACHD